MSIKVEIYDYVDNFGKNRFKEWFDGIGLKPKAKINTMLTNLAEEPLPKWHTWKSVENLSREDDLWVIKAKVDGVQWRAIGIMGPGLNKFTLLAGGTHSRGRGYEPRGLFGIAHERKANVRENPQRHRVIHTIK